MKLPRGRLVRSRVVSDPGTALAGALDRELTGYGVFTPHDALLLEADGAGVLTFEDGVPVLAYHTGTDRGGPAALADLAVPGPYRVELYALAPSALEDAHSVTELAVPAAMPAARLAGDGTLADRTRERVPGTDGSVGRGADEQPGGTGTGADPVASFLDDEEKVEAIREQAREEARERAAEWGFEDALADPE